MKFKTSRTGVLAALESIAAARTRKPALPALTGVKLSVTDGRMSLVGSDGAITVGVSLAVSDSEDGEALVAAKLLFSVVSRAKGDWIAAESNGSTLTLTLEGGEVALTEMPVDEYPKVAVPQGEVTTMDASALLRALADVESAAAGPDQPALHAVLVAPTPDGMSLVTTDRYRVARHTLEGAQHVFGEEPVLLPRPLVKAMPKVLKGDRTIQIRSEANRVAFSCGNTVLISRLLDGQFPAYAALFDNDTPNTLLCSSGPLLDALRLAGAVLVEDDVRTVRLILDGDGARVQAVSDHAGSATGTTIETSRYDGTAMTVHVDAALLEEGIAPAHPGVIQIAFGPTAESALRIQPAGGGSFTYLLMPKLKNA